MPVACGSEEPAPDPKAAACARFEEFKADIDVIEPYGAEHELALREVYDLAQETGDQAFISAARSVLGSERDREFGVMYREKFDALDAFCPDA